MLVQYVDKGSYCPFHPQPSGLWIVGCVNTQESLMTVSGNEICSFSPVSLSNEGNSSKQYAFMHIHKPDHRHQQDVYCRVEHSPENMKKEERMYFSGNNNGNKVQRALEKHKTAHEH